MEKAFHDPTKPQNFEFKKTYYSVLTDISYYDDVDGTPSQKEIHMDVYFNGTLKTDLDNGLVLLEGKYNPICQFKKVFYEPDMIMSIKFGIPFDRHEAINIHETPLICMLKPNEVKITSNSMIIGILGFHYPLSTAHTP
jgi:hypothetical protein